MGNPTMEPAPYTRIQYVRALKKLGPRVSEAHRRMLIAHAAAPRRDLDVLELAHAAGQRKRQFTSLQYGRLGHAIFDALGDSSKPDYWTRILADDYRDPVRGSVLYFIGWNE